MTDACKQWFRAWRERIGLSETSAYIIEVGVNDAWLAGRANMKAEAIEKLKTPGSLGVFDVETIEP